MPHINLQQLLENAWTAIKTWVITVYTLYPIPAWGITVFILLLFLYRFARFQHQYSEYKAAEKRRKTRGKQKMRTARNKRGKSHDHDHDKKEPTAHQTRRYGSKKDDRLEDWD